MKRPNFEELDLGFFDLTKTKIGTESIFLQEINFRDSNLKNIISSPEQLTKYQLEYKIFDLFFQQFQSTGFQDSNFFENNLKKIEKLIAFEFNNREFVTEIIDILTTKKNGKCEFFDVSNSIEHFMQGISFYNHEFNERHQLDSHENAYDLFANSKAAKYFYKKSLLDQNPNYIQANIRKIQFFIDFEKYAPRSFAHILLKNDGDIDKTYSQSNALELTLIAYHFFRERHKNIEKFFREYETATIIQDQQTGSDQARPSIQSSPKTMAPASQTRVDIQPRTTQAHLPSSSPVNLSSPPQSPLNNSFFGPRFP